MTRSEHVLYGVEDGSFDAFNKKGVQTTVLCGVLLESSVIVDVRLSEITVDGTDSTDELLRMSSGVKADAVILGGITFAGFNVMDPFRINGETGIPVIVYSGVRPDNGSMMAALKSHFNDWRERWAIVERLGEVYSTETFPREPVVYYEVVGESPEWAEEVLRGSAVLSRIPEPVRVAGLIARGVSSSV
ncbi:MAG: DUF99 family protein [Candidatus Bathyarchaeota archaeon]|nr:MAG: DUF99 family protein [Candidatus Bathyarchaeota archaeon]